MPKLSLNASKKTKHTPAGEIPVDWGWAGCFANGVGDGLGDCANRIEGNSGHSVGRIGGNSYHSSNRIGVRVGTRASGFGGFICGIMVQSYSPSALRYTLMAFQASGTRPNGPEELSEGLGPGGWKEYDWPLERKTGPCPGACATPDMVCTIPHTTPDAVFTMPRIPIPFKFRALKGR